MSASPIDGYLTKKEIEENYNRSHRSLTRDFSNAVRVGDSKVFPHLKLRTDDGIKLRTNDGNELVGTEVTLEIIQELSNQGLSPTWYAKQEWVQVRYAKETTKTKPAKQEKGSEIPPADEKPIVASTNDELVSTLKSQITRLEMENDRRVGEHQKDKDAFMEQIKMFKDMFDTLKEDHTDTKELLKEVHQVMGKFADVSLLGSQTSPAKSDLKKQETPTEQETVVDVANNSTIDAVVVEEPKQPKKTNKKSSRQGSQKSIKKKTTRSPSKAKRSTNKPKPKQHKWYETPTFNKFLSQKFSQIMEFHGFEHLTANYLYCPNQFFDVCLPNHSRGTVRLVAYMLRKTLGWLDKEGNPIEQNITVSYRNLIEEAGISRGAIRKALDEAVASGFITCIQKGQANGNNQSAETACYTLCWSTDNQYHKNLEQFDGFFAGEGHRTPIPNSFFDSVVKQEALSVVKVVGAVLRHTVGYQNQFGGRRQVAPLFYSFILKYTNLSDRTTLCQSLQHAIQAGYIRCVQKGGIDPSRSKRRPSTYAIRWQQQANHQQGGSKTRPANKKRYKNQTDNGSETRSVERFKNQTEEKPHKNNTYKQQNNSVVAVDLKNTKRFQLLQQAGFDENIAVKLSQKRGLEEIQKQIEWLPCRNPDRNSLGMLRRAIEEGWSKPDSIICEEKKQQRQQKDQKQATQAEFDDAQVLEAKQKKKHCREQLLPCWDGLSSEKQSEIKKTAFEKLNSDYFRDRFRRDEQFRLNHCLDILVDWQEHFPSQKQNDSD